MPVKSSSLEQNNHDSKIPMSETDIRETPVFRQIMILENIQQICAPV